MRASWGYVEAVAADVPSGDFWLSPAERALVARFPAAPRRADWRLGRWAAKRALAQWLGESRAPEGWHRLEVLPDASGRPVAFWRSRSLGEPLSLSHRAGRALALVGSAGSAVGCDLERIEPRSEAFVRDYFTDLERRTVGEAEPQLREILANLIWSAKESVSKLLGVGLSVDTRSLEIALDPEPRADGSWLPFRALRVAGGESFRGWWRAGDGWLTTVVRHPAIASPRDLAADPRPPA
ncbi:MAG: 4'-phosphopantetheinyl transferase superfamily protein [Acidobacteria bacterium]|nr:4'-phosphopantetheinyl transferase superfamily protein [Acidobacteriota bacterium]